MHSIRAYLGILRDSFHEAFASRVLWILLILTTLLLLALAPAGTAEQAGSYLSSDDIIDRSSLIKKLAREGPKPQRSPSGQVWSQLSEKTRNSIAAAAKTPDNRLAMRSANDRLLEELNALLLEPRLYEAPAWENGRLNLEARKLLNQGLTQLPPDQLARFNRLALEAAYPEQIAASSNKQVQLTYFGRKMFVPLPLSQDDLRPAIEQILLGFMVLVLGVGGVLTAILVTASIIPTTFEPGAIDLLLSKPVSRWLVFLTKFLGGCAFIFVNASYLILGIWMIVGWRFHLWNHKLLLCIPLFMFLFAIYYAVSALAGVIWKNAIVCVVLTVLFWATCFAVGTTHDVVATLVIQPARLVRIVPAGNALLAVSEQGKVLLWDNDLRDWEEVLADTMPRSGPAAWLSVPLLGPIYDERNNRILAANQDVPQLAMFGNPALLVGKPGEGWQRTEGVTLPAASEALFLGPGGEILAVAAGGVFRAEGNPEEKPKSAKVFGFEVPLPGSGARWVETTKNLHLSTPFSASIDSPTGRLAIYDGRKLLVLDPQPGGKYAVTQETEEELHNAGVLQLAGNTLMLALKNGQIRLYDASTLAVKQLIEPLEKRAPRYITSTSDGRLFAVLFHEGQLVLYDAQSGQASQPPLAGQGDISAAAFLGDKRLLVADRLTRVTEYHVPSWQMESRRTGRMNGWEIGYRYLLHPLYTVFPKPGALDNMITYLLTDETTVATSPREDDLSATRIKIDIWGPIWSNLAFLSVVLLLACIYVSRRDF